MRYDIVEAARLFKRAESGDRRAQFQFAESISQGDLIGPLVPTIRKMLNTAIAKRDTIYQRFTTRVGLPQIDRDVQMDTFGFNQENIADLNMGDDWMPGMLPRIANRESYPQIGFQASEKKTRVSLVGEAFGIDWQAIVNSRGTSINLIREAVNAFAEHVKNTDDAYHALAILTKSGFNTAKVGTTGHSIPGNPALDDILILQSAIQQAQKFQIDGVDVYFDKFALLTAPANVGQINQLLTTTSITKVPARTGADSAKTSIEYQQTINLGATVDVVPDQWLTARNKDFGRGWILVPVGGPRPCVTSNFLEGYETPSFWIKDGNARQVTSGGTAGGAVSELEGDFDSDAIQTKVRYAAGGDVLWNEGIVYSDGKGT
ncbi:hypothetical protein CMP1-15 [Clavibacter phage CMP1]|uniref:Major capsid protein n=1 Tax=Clavibacter phage CMP1 TaxID=686439 RepID=D0U1Z9_9CAUD|nr:hypothetical protein CMP1-15 [Clavibacter phage CMP1]ACY35911.1 hypothetical protein CMP1-15 [Clavibacter phage CMP1]